MNSEKKLSINLDSNMTTEEASGVLIGAVKFAIEKGGVYTSEQILQLFAAINKVTIPGEEIEAQSIPKKEKVKKSAEQVN